jgi:shikimate kinase
MALKKVIFLTGFKHVGKTTSGQKLASCLDVPFFDLDKIIEKKNGCKVSALFDPCNPENFRDLELSALKSLDLNVHQVIALGGGTLDSEKNCEFIKKNGIVFGLSAPFEIVFERIMVFAPSFSLMDKNDPMGSLLDLYNRRKKQLETVALTLFDATSETLIEQMEEYVRKHIW